jgi:hypothetical protein
VGHTLSEARRADFTTRSEFRVLAEFTEAVLRRAADIARKRDQGNLLLAEWLAACRSARRALPDAEGRYEVHSRPKWDRSGEGPYEKVVETHPLPTTGNVTTVAEMSTKEGFSRVEVTRRRFTIRRDRRSR